MSAKPSSLPSKDKIWGELEGRGVQEGSSNHQEIAPDPIIFQPQTNAVRLLYQLVAFGPQLIKILAETYLINNLNFRSSVTK